MERKTIKINMCMYPNTQYNQVISCTRSENNMQRRLKMNYKVLAYIAKCEQARQNDHQWAENKVTTEE